MDSNNKYSQLWKKNFTISETERGHLIVHLASVIWQPPRQLRWQHACQISEWYDHYNIQSHDFETSHDLTARPGEAAFILDEMQLW